MAYLNRTEIDTTYPPETVYGYIYLWTNKINNRQYVGQTINLDLREQQHLTQNVQLIDRKIKEYGEENFERVIIDIAYNEEELDTKEVKWIDFYHTFESGYNCTAGGKGIKTKGENHPKFGGCYYKLETIFGEFIGCFAGVFETARKMATHKDTNKTFKSHCSAISSRNIGNISFDTPHEFFIITPISKEAYVNFENVKPKINITKDITEVTSNGSQTLHDFTSIYVSEFKALLDKKQLAVLNKLLNGKTQTEISSELNISQPTVCRTIKTLQNIWLENN